MKTYWIETWGCQMNVLDSQYLAGQLEAWGLAPVEDPVRADVVLLNTCAVREKAVQKVLSRLGELRQQKKLTGKPEVVGLCGCVAEQEGAKALARSQVLDFVLGPGRVGQLPAVLAAVTQGQRVSLTGFSATRDLDTHLITRTSSARQYVTVIHGCDQHCTFCVVPYTRGPEMSRPLKEVVAEVQQLVARGALEVTLLGQTINAYRCPETGADFADLLQAVTEVEGLWRLQFITSHPKFFSKKLIRALASLPRLGTYLHVPFQAGSNRILRAMRRRYTKEEYLALVEEIRGLRPQVAFSTDVIVGFPGETEEDFAETMDVVERVQFSQLYGFIFSPRPKTPAAGYPDQVPRVVAGQRLERLFAAQAGISLSLNQAMIGQTVKVLVDGEAKRGAGLWQGRGEDNRVVNFPFWEGIAPGQLVDVRITGATAHSLLGERWQPSQPPGALPRVA
ncbi:MAG: tRNA (N6-isopentenyl adenosine(37)-C2)-methylthiotransferase MiaB [Thermoanaerobaculum sp.]|nr:tRNA (N6-isopentenyl adenosine(37)-C2)-methylthiotransferase MiaB [Thermoanaerobaculum sp.]MDW7966967.1 tRNA (N6-isopentenyl adenosine(37)-C2)-methylthiotransferase MiaB [Thermoanaerobaculum sp.]